MTKSMTGYGRAQRLAGGRDITVELRSVNHRYFELSARAPRSMSFLEEKLKSYLQSKIFRGKVDLGIQIVTVEDSSAQVEINMPLAQSYLTALREMGSELKLQDDLTVSSLARFSEIFTLRKKEEDQEEIWQAVLPVLEEAVEGFLTMRQQEGERLKADLLARADTIEKLVEFVKERSPQTVAQYRERLYAKLREVLEDSRFDDQRVLTEAAIFAEKVAVDEETVRLESHLASLRQILSGSGPVGRKLDFLVQEINREANTIGSKAQDLEIARVVVEIKSEIEKIREQVQNIE